MEKFFVMLMGICLFSNGCAEQPPREKALALVNSGAVSGEVASDIQGYMEEQLHVPVRLLTEPSLNNAAQFEVLQEQALKKKTESDVAYIVISSVTDTNKHLMVHSETGVAMINVAPLQAVDAEQFARRVERQAMRAAAFLFGLEPTPDPFCVTRNYTTVEELDRMGRNYSPPWQKRYAEEAAARGLKVDDPFMSPSSPPSDSGK